MTPPLAGVRVVDLTHFVAGPWCTMLLADLGAEVTKIEPPVTGEIGRRMGAVHTGGESAIYLAFNRNKRSVALDLKDPRGREAAHRLIADTDVVVQNMRPAAASALGMDASSLSATREDLIYCAISAFGRTGPYAGKPGNDPIIQALSGAMWLCGGPHGRPARMGVSLPDFAAGVLAAVSITSALHRRRHTGHGATLELNLLDAQLFAQIDHILREAYGHTEEGPVPEDVPVLGLTEAIAARPSLVERVNHPTVGSLPMLRTPVGCTPAWAVAHRPPPRLGEHTTEVLAELGYSQESIKALYEAGVAHAGQ
ncbi:CaiB/BaiF CoA transferase family protein [Streptomyces purpurogeneiscleroticus]|uniref:CaiB/BaiF CoA transferase family protein n=1 Tax=Streptomyces purpurogeneiscleroticus TaxID=68259 RepID=UPI001CC030C7|nr:CoA transferase [Streptomyces purpurogeneiscleroticus]MBZ4017647.1 hypothetical protein [Streptomyces purpurogeneiscleroticus]